MEPAGPPPTATAAAWCVGYCAERLSGALIMLVLAMAK